LASHPEGGNHEKRKSGGQGLGGSEVTTLLLGRLGLIDLGYVPIHCNLSGLEETTSLFGGIRTHFNSRVLIIVINQDEN
jgi:hypothetical protein